MIATAEPVARCEGATREASLGGAAPAVGEGVVEPGGGRQTTTQPLEQAVRRRIVQRTWGRLRHLQVEVDARHVVVRGSSPTYYLKQLALAAVQEALPATPVELAIRVAKSEPGLARAGGARAGLLS